MALIPKCPRCGEPLGLDAQRVDLCEKCAKKPKSKGKRNEGDVGGFRLDRQGTAGGGESSGDGDEISGVTRPAGGFDRKAYIRQYMRE